MSRVSMEAELILAPPTVREVFSIVADASTTYRLLRGKDPTPEQVTMMMLGALNSQDATAADVQWLVDAEFMPASFMADWAEYQAIDAVDAACEQCIADAGHPFAPPHDCGVAGHRPHCTADSCW